MLVYHAGYLAIEKPDVYYGRKNADFGQGFYVTPDGGFARRWARQKRGLDTVLNVYDLDTDGLSQHAFRRGTEWAGYILQNRGNGHDSLQGTDIITGPIACDTIYDSLGIASGGFLGQEGILTVFTAGREYTQIALKTPEAAEHLRFLRSEIIDPREVARLRAVVAEEEKAYQSAVAELLMKTLPGSDR